MAQSRILIVEDEPLVRRAFERILQDEHEVVCVGSISEAIGALEGLKFSAIVNINIDICRHVLTKPKTRR